MRRIWLGLLLLPGLLGPGRTVLGQIDPEPRKLLQFGFNQPLEGAAPIAGYMFYFLNDPNFLRTNLTLRLAIAPVYLDSELGIRGALGPDTDLGLGLAGGGFADSYFEYRDGKFLRSDSFTGHSAEVSGSIYHLFNPGQTIPLNGILRLREHFSVYDEDDHTSESFVLPHDHSTVSLRTGLRWGGKEPVIHPDLAMELSAWYEGQFRTDSGSYGYNGDRVLEPFSQLMFARALLIYTLPESKQNLSLSLTGGGSGHADRFSAYRLGGNLPLSAEFPLLIPGYFYEELSARDLCHLERRVFRAAGRRQALEPDHLRGHRRDGLFARTLPAGPHEFRSGNWHGLSCRLLAGSDQLWLRLRSHSRRRARRAEHRHSASIRFGSP